MYAFSLRTTQEWVAITLAIASVGFFWLEPWSPMIAFAALLATHHMDGWTRNIAVAGTVLVMARTIVMAVGVLWVAWHISLI